MLLAEVLERVIEPVSDLIANDATDADLAGLGQRFQPRRHIHPIAKDVLLLDDHVAEVYTHPEVDPLIGLDRAVPLGHTTLELDGAAHRVDHTRKLRQEALASVLHDTATVLADLRIDQLLEVGFEPFVRTFLIGAHQPRVTGHVCGEDRGEAAGLAHSVSPVTMRRPDRNSSRWSGLRNNLTVGITLGVMTRNRATTSRASFNRPICA